MPARALLAALAILLASGAGCAVIRFQPDRAEGFRLLDTPHGRYYAYVPGDAAARVQRGEKLPVILYLHGGDERGDDPVRPTQVGLGPFVAERRGAFPFVVLFPQCPRGGFWAKPAEQARVLALLDDALPRVGGDPERVILTGNSLGGYGSWLIGAQHPERFAAIVPICGGVAPPKGVSVPKESRFGHLADPYTAVARALGQMPVWAFHGAEDWVVSPAQSRRMYAALKAAGNPAKYTEYPGVGHASWNKAYADPALFQWMAQRRRAVAPAN